MCRSFIGCVVFPRKSFISGCWTEPPAALTVLCCWIPVSSLSCVGVCKGRLIFKVPGGFDLSVVVWIHLKPHKMQPEEVMLPLFSLMQRLEHLPNFNSFFCLRPFHSHFWLICWETLSSACWVLSWVLKLPHFQDFSCVSEPLDLKASLSDLLDPEVPLLHWKGGVPCLWCPAGWWPGALLGCGVEATGQGRQDPCLYAQPTEHQCGCHSGWSHSLFLKADHCWRLNT